MVSLGGDRRSPGGGGCTFTEEEENSGDCDLLLTNTLLDMDYNLRRFFPYTVRIVIMIQTLCIIGLLGLLVCCIMLPYIFYINIAHVMLCCVLFITQIYLRRHHNQLKLYGYLQFYKQTYLLIRLPFITFSFGNSILLMCDEALHHFCSSDLKLCPPNSKMEDKYYFAIIFFLEMLMLFPLSCLYIWFVIKFIKLKAAPDMQREDDLTNSVVSRCPVTEIGIRDGDFREEIIEKQADAIHYLKQHNAHLNRKILQLTEELRYIRPSV